MNTTKRFDKQNKICLYIPILTDIYIFTFFFMIYFVLFCSIIGFSILGGWFGWEAKKRHDKELEYRREIRKMERIHRHRQLEEKKYRDMIFAEAEKRMQEV